MKYVYLLRVGDNHYKVGVSTNVTGRVKALQSSNPRPISIVTTRLVNDAYRVENDIHDFLSDRHVGEGREWFELTPEEALNMAVILNRNPEIDMTQQITVRTILAQQTARQKDLESSLKFILEVCEKLSAGLGPAKPTASTVPAKPDLQESEELLIQQAVTVFRNAGGQASVSLLQRRLRIGYGKAARVLDKLTSSGVVSEPDGNRPRRLLVDLL